MSIFSAGIFYEIFMGLVNAMQENTLKTHDFYYDLPQELIAQTPWSLGTLPG